MRNLLIAIIALFSINAYSQSFDSRLLQVYTKEYLQNLDNSKLQALQLTLDSSYYFIDNFEKYNDLPELKKLDLSTKTIDESYQITNQDINNFNPFLFSFDRKYSQKTYYKFGNTGKTIVFYSNKELAEIINRNK